jgi:hypothetical protein
MARFEIGDKIGFFRKNEAIRKGVVVSGPWSLEKIDHYNVKWEWVEADERMFMSPDKIDLICDIPSTKYHYEPLNN